MYIYTNKPSKVLSDLTKLLMTDEVTRIDGISWRTPQKQFIGNSFHHCFCCLCVVVWIVMYRENLYIRIVMYHANIHSHTRTFPTNGFWDSLHEQHAYSYIRNNGEMNFQWTVNCFRASLHERHANSYTRNNGEMNFKWTGFEVLYMNDTRTSETVVKWISKELLLRFSTLRWFFNF